MENEPEAQVVADLAAAGLNIKFVGDAETPFVILPNGYTLQSLEHLLDAPTRIKKDIGFISLESFTRYVNKFKTLDTRITIGPVGNAKAVIDGSGADDPKWEGHVAGFSVTYSERWRTWDALNRRPLSQKQFAEFVEDNNPDFIAPKGASMLDIAETLSAEVNSLFEGAIKTGKDNVSLTYKKTTTGKAGQNGEVEIPSMFTIGIPVLENESPRPIEVRLRYELNEGKLTLTYDIFRRANLMEQVRRSIFATIKNETELEPFLVA